MRVPKYSTKFYSSISDFSSTLLEWQNAGLSIVFTNGCFDIVHKGHIDCLYSAAKLSDKMVVGLNSDISIKKIKGTNRPIIEQKSRAAVLSAISCIDAVIMFDEETPLNLIKSINPDVIIKGAEYKIEDMIGREYVEGKGGKVITVPMSEGYSTSNIIEKIKKS